LEFDDIEEIVNYEEAEKEEAEKNQELKRLTV